VNYVHLSTGDVTTAVPPAGSTGRLADKKCCALFTPPFSVRKILVIYKSEFKSSIQHAVFISRPRTRFERNVEQLRSGRESSAGKFDDPPFICCQFRWHLFFVEFHAGRLDVVSVIVYCRFSFCNRSRYTHVIKKKNSNQYHC